MCGDLPDLEAGVYHYAAQDHALRQLRRGDLRDVVEPHDMPEGLCAAAQNGSAFVGEHVPCVPARAEWHGPHVRAPDQVQNRLWHGLHSPIPQPITETIRSAALAR